MKIKTQNLDNLDHKLIEYKTILSTLLASSRNLVCIVIGVIILAHDAGANIIMPDKSAADIVSFEIQFDVSVINITLDTSVTKLSESITSLRVTSPDGTFTNSGGVGLSLSTNTNNQTLFTIEGELNTPGPNSTGKIKLLFDGTDLFENLSPNPKDYKFITGFGEIDIPIPFVPDRSGSIDKVNIIPIPASIMLMGSGLIALGLFDLRRVKKPAI